MQALSEHCKRLTALQIYTMSGLFNTVVKTLSGPYKKVLASRLRTYGLKYDDVLIEHSSVLKALSRTNHVAKVERERRIVRAFDQSFKRKPLAPEVAAAYDPYDLYLQENVELAEFEQAEKEVIRG